MPARVGSESGLGHFGAYVGLLCNRAYFARYYKLSMPAMVSQLKGAIQHILNLNHPDGKASPLGQHFITHWLAANPDCKRVKQKPKELDRVAANSREVYHDHFNEFKTVV